MDGERRGGKMKCPYCGSDVPKMKLTLFVQAGDKRHRQRLHEKRYERRQKNKRDSIQKIFHCLLK